MLKYCALHSKTPIDDMHAYCEKEKKKSTHQGGRHWQPLGGRKMGQWPQNFLSGAYLLFFGGKCVAFWSNCKRGQFNSVNKTKMG